MTNVCVGRQCVGRLRVPSWRRPPQLGRRPTVCTNASENGDRSDKSLSTLDSLLGSTDEPPPNPKLVEWWRIRPRQAAPPRTTSISSARSPAGRFIANEEMLRNEVWAGGKTLPGQALELPKATPYLSYMLALVNAAVYGTAVRVCVTQGADAADELLAGLVFSHGAVGEQGELWRLLSGCFVQADLAPLAVVLYGLLVVAPRVEASLGYRTFAVAFLLPLVVAADTVMALGGGGGAAVAAAADAAPLTAATAAAGTSGAVLAAVLHPASQALASASGGAGSGLWLGGLGAVMGLAGCSCAHQLVNGDVERSASGAAASTSAGTGAVAPPADVRTALLVAGGAAVALQHALEPGGAVLVAALGVAFAAGFVLSYTAGPRYQVTREVEIPDGSMWIPDPDAMAEMTVVLDQTTSIQRTLATGSLATLVSLASLAVLYGCAR